MNPDIVIADAARLGMFPSESMPAVYSSHTLEHIEDYRAELAEWWRLVALESFTFVVVGRVWDIG